MKKLEKFLLPIIKSWDQFWFKPVETLPLACFRFCVSFILLVAYSIRFFDIRLFYYESGLISSATARVFHNMEVAHSLNFILSSHALLYICYLAFLIILLMMVVGVSNRWLAMLAFVLHLIFIQRNPAIAYGMDIIATFWLFYLIFASSHSQIKWVHYFINKRKYGLISDKKEKGGWLNTVALRFIQIQLCVIYFFNGLEKLRGKSWLEGTAIWEALSFDDFVMIDFSFMSSFPLIMGGLSMFIVLFEVYFPILVWISRLRMACLITGVLFHTSIVLCLGLYFFSPIMLSAYVLFLPPEMLKRFFDKFHS